MVSFEPIIRLILLLLAVLMVLCGSAFLAVVHHGTPGIARTLQLGFLGMTFFFSLAAFVLMIRAVR